MSDYSFIKEFQNIKLSKICKKYNVNLSNIISGITTEENFRKIKYEIIRELLMLFIDDRQDDLCILYLYNELLEKLEKENKALREMI